MSRNVKTEPSKNDLAQLQLLFNHNKLTKCEVLARQLTKKYPKHGFAWKVLGVVLQKLERAEESLAAKMKAAALSPHDAEAFNNLASTLASFNRHQEAVTHYKKALALNANYIEAHYNLGISLEKVSHLEEAEISYRQAITLRSDYSEAHTNLALLLLKKGQFQEGWKEYQWSYHPRNTTPNKPKQPNLSILQWQGESLQGKTILIYSEQGLGDMIQFVRYAEPLKAMGATVWVLANRTLIDLFKTVPWVDRVLAEGEQYTLEYDFWVFPFSLPFLLQTTLKTIPSNLPYLFVNETKSVWWQDWLNQHIPSKNKRVGLVWAGNSAQPNDKNRSLALNQFAVFAHLPNITFISLQLGEKAQKEVEHAPVGLNIIDASSFIQDFTDSAALLDNLDLLITVCSAPAHLAGALNLPVWTMISKPFDWRWLLERNDSVWYASMRLFRQPESGNWASVLDDVKLALNQLQTKKVNITSQDTASEPLENEQRQLEQLFNQNKLIECDVLARKLTKKFPKHGFAWKVLGAVLQKLGQIDESLDAKRQAAELLPQDAEAHSNLATALMQQDLFKDAEASCRKALELDSELVSAHNNLGLILQKLGRLKEAEMSFRSVLTIKADFPDVYSSLGNVLKEQGRFKEAENVYFQGVSLTPVDVNLICSIGNFFKDLNRLDEAEFYYLKALEINPNKGDIYNSLGNNFLAKRQFPEARDAYDKVFELMPENFYSLGQAIFIKRMLCEWKVFQADNEKLLKCLQKQQPARGSVTTNFPLLAVPSIDAQHLKQAAKTLAESRYKSHFLVPPVVKIIHQNAKLRIGYLSADFHSHATVYLLAGILKNRNTQKFTTYLYSYGTDYKDEGRSLMETSCEYFREVSLFSDEDIAQQISADKIDVLVDLKGYTENGRLGITALRPAPVIVSWLGYPGTLGHERLADYIIGDATVTPLEHADHFSETLALMPHCYQPNDNQRSIGACPNRAKVGLPENAFVFCTFNQSYKITPEMFSIWCRLLAAVPNSVLWLLEPHPVAQENLKREMQARGVDSTRLIFASKMEQTAHLGRLQLADLAVDTFPYTSHTTASDALWAGVPLVTKMGETFASRVAASILKTMDLAELVTDNDEDYFNVALNLAQNPEKLAAIKQKIAIQKQISPLFDTQLFTKDLELLYQMIWEQELKGERKPILLMPDKSNAKAESQTSLQTVDTKSADEYYDIANELLSKGCFEKAEIAYHNAIKIRPNFMEAFNNLGNTVKELGRLDEAENNYHQAISINPNCAELYINLGNLLKDGMRFMEAENAYRKALEINPDYLTGYTYLLFAISHNEQHSQEFCTEEAKRYGQVVSEKITPFLHSPIGKNAHKKLKIGFVSGDFCDHSVAFFIEPLLGHINKNQFELFAYYSNTTIDDMTQRFQKHFSVWRDVASLTDEGVAQQIKNDEIDIAIDLSGHTAKNRLLAFARKPAPIQVSWIGYPATTGLQTMDYYLVDADWCPEGLLDEYFTEKLVRLPSAFTFQAPINSPDVTDSPALKNGYITFGSFNRTSKLTAQTLDLWCKVLNEIPDSKMLLGNVSDMKLQQRLEADFFQRGVSSDRLIFHSRKDILGYLALHSEVDLILDTYPLAGITITGFALWMGVPVLTYAWKSLAGRGGVAMLSRVDLQDQFVAETEQQFIELAKSWRQNIEGLQALRYQLRDRMQHSEKCKPENVAAGLETALQMMWQRFCLNLPVESFTASLLEAEKLTINLTMETKMNDVIAQNNTPIRLDLGCGLTPKKGFEGVDFFTPTAKHQVNLMKFPWLWEDNSVDEIFTSHFLERLPMVFVNPNGDYSVCPETPEDRDLLFRFMDECWRIMKPNAKMTIIVPSGRSNRGFQDPSHRRFFVGETFNYFNAAWRNKYGISHYIGGCDFSVQVEFGIKDELLGLSLEEQNLRFETQWNSVQDFQATLIALKF